MTTDQRLRLEGYLYLVAFGLCIPAANWMIGHVGTTCVPDGPCLVPVAPGLAAPSGVLMIGLALVLRDLVQRRLGPGWTAIAIVLALFYQHCLPREPWFLLLLRHFSYQSLQIWRFTHHCRRSAWFSPFC